MLFTVLTFELMIQSSMGETSHALHPHEMVPAVIVFFTAMHSYSLKTNNSNNKNKHSSLKNVLYIAKMINFINSYFFNMSLQCSG